MKKIITLLSLVFLAQLSFTQIVFQSDLSSWDSTGNPTDFFGSKTSISAANVTQVTTGAIHGTSFANVLNSGSSHKRLTTQPITVIPGRTYIIKMWIAGTAGDVRVNYYDLSGSSYGSYTSYQTVSGTALTVYTDSIVAPSGCTSLEYIISLRNTAALGIGLDSVSISGVVGPPPPPPSYSAKTIYQIQYTTATSGDSPYEDSLIETTGVVTGTHSRGYFIQDGNTAWNGIYVYDNVNTPSRGDKITVKAKVKEYYNLTELTNVDTMITVSTGNALPTPIALNTTTIADEKYEGLLVKVSAVMCVDSNAGNGEWDVANTAMDSLPVDDLIFRYTPVLYQGYDVTGLVHYSFGEYKLEPRDSMDIVQSLVVSIDEVNNGLSFKAYPNPVENIFTLSGINLETAQIYTTTGKLVRTITLNTINTIDVSDLKDGVYILKVTSGSNVGTTRFVKQ